MAEYATKNDLDGLEKRLDKRFEKIDKKFDNFGKSVDKKFDDFEKRVDKKFDDFEKKVNKKIDWAVDELTGIIREFAGQVDERFNRLEARVDKIEQNLDRNAVFGSVTHAYQAEYAFTDDNALATTPIVAFDQPLPAWLAKAKRG